MTRCRAGASLALIVCATALTTGCYRDRIIVKPVPVEIVRYVQQPIPSELTAPISVHWPDGLCWLDGRVLCNGQLDHMARIAYPRALEQCNADRKALRAEQ